MTQTSRPRRPRRWLRRTLVVVAAVVLIAVLGVVSFGAWVVWRIGASLPALDGRYEVAGVEAPVRIERDTLGVPTIRGADRFDVAYATGFVHAQDRFFQMDLLRRRAAGELAEVFGERSLAEDRAVRPHRFRVRAGQVLAAASPSSRRLIESYSRGVNAGLAALPEPPFEHALLGVKTRPWSPEDTVLVLFTLFLQLEDVHGEFEDMVTLFHEYLPPQLFEFLLPLGTTWDSPMVGDGIEPAPLPGPEDFSYRKLGRIAHVPPPPTEEPSRHSAASNAWAVAGEHTARGGAFLVNDLHQDFRVPNVWYRASLVWTDDGGETRVTGATLPGLPLIIVGSNGHVAWGVTANRADTSDRILLEIDPDSSDTYSTPEGPKRFERFEEILAVRGGEPETLEVLWTVWGPVVERDGQGRLYAIRSMVHEPGGVDFEIARLEAAETVGQAMDVAQTSGAPVVNFLVADASGDVGWTVLGRLPTRVGFTGRVATSWADGSRRWDGLLPPEEIPHIVAPESGRVWSGNQRVVDGEDLRKMGWGNYGMGARARQIHDGLMTLDAATREDMWNLLFDDRAVFLQRWHRHLLEDVLVSDVVAGDERLRELRDAVVAWGARASVDSVGYRMVRTYRFFLARRIFAALTAACREADPDFDYTFNFNQIEGPLWQIVRDRPPHLLPPGHETWQDFYLDVVREMLAFFGEPLSERTVGELNTLSMRHPFSFVVPGVGRWLDMPPVQLPGSDHMPLVLDPDFGSTLRMVVTPGREDEGFFHMPAGQSANPRSPHYKDSQESWAEGRPTPFLPGPAVHEIVLTPGGTQP